MELSTFVKDPVALFSLLSVVGAIIVVGYLTIKVVKLMNTTRSND